MQLTLRHQTSQQEAIKKIDDYLNELMKEEYPGVTVIEPQKNWEDYIMRFSFTIQKMLFTLDFSGTVIVTDAEVIGDSDVPDLVLNFIPEEKIKKIITQKFNELFDIN